MLEQQIRLYQERVQQTAEACEEPVRLLLHELMKELEGLAEENKRLRQAVVKGAGGSAGMASKLKDALYE